MTARASVSLVVPLQDEEASVVALLRSITAQTRLPDELVFVDAGSRDATVDRIRAYDPPCPTKIVAAGRVFPGVARNHGVESSQAEWIAFTDGGVELSPTWIQELLDAATAECDVVYGGLEPICDSHFRECAAIAYVPSKDASGLRGASIASSLVRRSAILSVGGFPPYRAAEDLIFIDALRRAGAREAHAPKAHIAWQIPGTPRSLFGRFALYSEHNLAAGWGHDWHCGVLRSYAILSVGASAVFAVFGAGGALATLPIFFLARACKAAWTKRSSFSFATLHPMRVLGVAGVLLMIDVAMLVGIVRWMTRDGHKLIP